MPDAISVVLAAQFADPNIGRNAVYIAEGGAPVLVRIVARRADAGSFRRPDGIEAGTEPGVGVADQEARRDLLFRAPHQGVAGLLGHPCRVGGVGRGAAEHAAAAEVDEDQHMGRQRPTFRKHGLGEEVAGDQAFHMRTDERGPRKGRLLFPLLGARVDARLIEDALDRIGGGTEPELFQLPGNPLVAPEKVFGPDANDDVAPFLRQTRPAHGLERASAAHLSKPALAGAGLATSMSPSISCPHSAPMRSSSDFSAGDRIILCAGMRARRIWIWARCSRICALCRGMTSRDKRTRRREKVEFILPGSTTALKKLPSCQCDETSVTFWHPAQEGQKRAGRTMAVVRPPRAAADRSVDLRVRAQGPQSSVSLPVATEPDGHSNHHQRHIKQ